MTVNTLLRALFAGLTLILLVALMLVLAAPVRLWLGLLELPEGVAISRADGSLRQGELVFQIDALGRDRPVFFSWSACDMPGLQRCWQAQGRALQGEGKLGLSPTGMVSISDSSLQGDMTLDGLFLFPVSGRWQADVASLQFLSGACLPREIYRLQADVQLLQGKVLEHSFETHYASVSRLPGQDLQVAIDGYSVEGQASMNSQGEYHATLSLRLPRGLNLGPALGGVQDPYMIEQQGIIRCL